jgi:ubiquinone/menaquinone biosynthesis C-methylase UbiE
MSDRDLDEVTERLLSSAQAERFYDTLGKKLDSQTFYEAPALNDLAAHLDFENCRAVLEFGCGTGRFAEELFETRLPPHAIYVGRDISNVMVRLARERLARFGSRATIEKSEGGARIDSPNGAFDRFVCTFVLDLLTNAEAQAVISEAQRVLAPGGLAGLVSLTNGRTPIARIITTVWNGLRAVSPMLVGGCRPVEILSLVPALDWKIEHQNIVTPFGIPCEIVVTRKTHAP